MTRQSGSVQARYLISAAIGFIACCIGFILLVLLQIGGATESSRYIDEIHEIKTEAAVNVIDQPKLLVIGGSNALFGISCEQIQEQIQFPCVNGATQAGLGIKYMFDRAESWLHAGDMVLLTLEYFHYRDGDLPNDMVIDYVFAHDADYLKRTDIKTKLQFVSGISFTRILRGLAAKVSPPQPRSDGYQAETLNALGDETNNSEDHRPPEGVSRIQAVSPLDASALKSAAHNSGIQSIERFVAWCQENNVEVLATWPNTIWFEEYAQPENQALFRDIESLYGRLGVPMLGQFSDFMFARSMFYDTGYHLHDRGVEVRTELLAQHLEPFINAKKVSETLLAVKTAPTQTQSAYAD